MESKRDIFEELIKDALQDMAPEPSAKVWKGIVRRLSWKEFLRFDITNFTSNIYQIAAVSLAGVSLTALLLTAVIQSREQESEKKEPPRQELTEDIQGQPNQSTDALTTEEPVKEPVEKSQPVLQQAKHLEEPIPQPSIEITQTHQIRYSITFRPSPKYSLLKTQYPTLASSSDELHKPALLKDEKAPWQINLGASWSWNRMQIPEATGDYRYNFNTLGLKANAVKGNFRFGAGLAYQRLFDQLPYQINYKTYDSTGYIFNVHYYMPDPKNPDMVILITSKETVYDSVKHSTLAFTSGSYDYLTIPFSVGYKLLIFNKFSIFMDGNATLQFLVHKNEPVPALFNSYKSSLSMEADLPRRKNLLIDLGAGLTLEYTIFNRLNLIAGPSWRWWLQPLSNNPEASKPSAWGIKAGIDYKF